ncbi:MAG: ROK family protein [Actinomycetota bacterium]
MAFGSGRSGATLTQHYAGFDIGGTKTLAVVVDRDGTVVVTKKTPRPKGPDETVAQLCGLVGDVADEAGVSIDAVGIGIAGAISRRGSVQFSPNIPELVDFPLADHLADCIHVPIVVDNDATAATWAEHQLGAGQGVDDLLYVALGTGIGTGFVLDGRIYRGANGFAGESGHIVIDRHGDPHISGVRGPWEMYASGNGLGALARVWADEGRLPGVSAIAGGQPVRGEHVSRAISNGDADALTLLEAFAEHVAVGLTNLIYVLDPARIVLGGGLVDIGEPLRERVQRQVDQTTLGGAFRPSVPVVLAELGSRSGALGAAMLARELVS